jgi:hypothetical protein
VVVVVVVVTFDNKADDTAGDGAEACDGCGLENGGHGIGARCARCGGEGGAQKPKRERRKYLDMREWSSRGWGLLLHATAAARCRNVNGGAEEEEEEEEEEGCADG